jgi:hypothetical protein
MHTDTNAMLWLTPNQQHKGALGTHLLVFHVELFAQQNSQHIACVQALQLITTAAVVQSRYLAMKAAEISSRGHHSRNPTKRIGHVHKQTNSYKQQSSGGDGDEHCNNLEPGYDKKCDPSNNDKVPGPRSRAQTGRGSPARSALKALLAAFL